MKTQPQPRRRRLPPAAEQKMARQRRLERPRQTRDQRRRALPVTPRQQQVQRVDPRRDRRRVRPHRRRVRRSRVRRRVGVGEHDDPVAADLQRMAPADVLIPARLQYLQIAPLARADRPPLVMQVDHGVDQVRVQSHQPLQRVQFGRHDRRQPHRLELHDEFQKPRARFLVGEDRAQVADRIDQDPPAAVVVHPVGDVDQQPVGLPPAVLDHLLRLDEDRLDLPLLAQSAQIPAEPGRVGVKLLGGLLERDQDPRFIELRGAGDQDLQPERRLARTGRTLQQHRPAGQQAAAQQLVQSGHAGAQARRGRGDVLSQ
ncbi:MAG: hypothetical protein BWZ08_02848 [candidate division BRC1 bacterium ADurb.BinA292]|nr:MAG: hypothetical protein BWZ08_02848 [candidate division BRC1 bacterium ADurb.BinA292]